MRRIKGPCTVLAAMVVSWALVLTPASGASDTTDQALNGYLSANGMLNRGLYELAAAEYREFLSDHDRHEKAPVAHYGLGVCLFRMNKFPEAVKELAPLQKRSGFEFAAEVGTMLGQCYLSLHKHAEAAKAFDVVVRRHGDHGLADEAGAGQAEALYLDEKYKEAAASCGRFVNRWPESHLLQRVTFFWGLALMSEHEFAEAAEQFSTLLERDGEGPFAEQTTLLLAQCHQHDGALKKAVRQYRKAVKKLSDEYLPDALFGLATLLQQLEEWDEAGALLDRLLERYPDSPLTTRALFHRGRVWFSLGHYDRAFAMFRRAAGTGEELKDESSYWMAKCRLRDGDFEDAARRLEQAAHEFPESRLLAEMIYDRGVALIRAGAHEEAVAAFTEFRSRFPDHAQAGDALHLLAMTEHQRSRYDESIEHCQTFTAQYSSHRFVPALAFLEAENEFLAGRNEKAVEAYRGFLARHADDAQAPKAQFRLGTALYRLDRFEEAEAHLARVTGGAATDALYRPALLALGDIKFQGGAWKDAEQHLSDYLASGLSARSADDALLKLGLARQRLRRYAEAIEAYDLLLAQFEDSVHRLQAMFERGQALVALDRPDDAEVAFEQVVAAENNSRFAAYALNHLAAIAMNRQDYRRTAKLYERVARAAEGTALEADALFQSAQALLARQRFSEAEEAFTRFLDRAPEHAKSAEAKARRAITLARQDRHAEAVEAIERVEQESGDALGRELRDSLRYERAWCLKALGRFDEAREAYDGLLEDDPDEGVSAYALLELAGLHVDQKRYEQAAKLLRRLREIMEGDSTVPQKIREQGTYRLGVCEFQLERFRDALELFTEFVERFPQSPLMASASFFGGEAALTLGKHAEAIEHLSRVAKHFPKDPVYGPGLLRLGESLASGQLWARSEAVFTKYLQRFGDSEHAYQARFGVGWAREHQKRYDAAVEAYQRVVAGHQGPTAARAQFQIGECLFAQKKHDEAVRELLKVDILYAYPEWSAAALFEAARCFERLGKTVEARTHFRQVADAHPRTRWAEMASQRLSELSSAMHPGR